MKTSSKSESEMESIKKKLKAIINSIPDVVEDERGKFRKNDRKIWLNAKRSKVTVEPLGYSYKSLKRVLEHEFKLKGAVDGYFKYGFMEPRLTFVERKENGRTVLCCKMTGAKIYIEFRPRWLELLDGVNRMVFTEYKNAKKAENAEDMLEILQSLRKITKRAEIHYQALGCEV